MKPKKCLWEMIECVAVFEGTVEDNEMIYYDAVRKTQATSRWVTWCAQRVVDRPHRTGGVMTSYMSSRVPLTLVVMTH